MAGNTHAWQVQWVHVLDDWPESLLEALSTT